jgi:prophage regulatory protein
MVANAQVVRYIDFIAGERKKKRQQGFLLMDILDTSAQNPSLPRLLPISAVQSEFGLHRTTVYSLVNSGSFPKPIRIGRRYRWVFSEVQSWLNEQMAAR